jgi:hypothetical protein
MCELLAHSAIMHMYQLGSKEALFYALEGAITMAGKSVRWLLQDMQLVSTYSEISAISCHFNCNPYFLCTNQTLSDQSCWPDQLGGRRWHVLRAGLHWPVDTPLAKRRSRVSPPFTSSDMSDGRM